MLKPEPMTRVLIISAKSHQRELVERLYALRLAHLIEFNESAEDPDLKIGRPMPGASEAADKLVRLRGMARALSLEGASPSSVARVRELIADLERRVAAMESEVHRAAQQRDEVAAKLKEAEERGKRVEPFAAMPLDLEDYRGYDNVAVFTGTSVQAFEESLRAVTTDYFMFRGEGGLFALFVPSKHEDATAEVLMRAGYKPIEAPEGTGRPADILARLRREVEGLAARLTQAEAELARLAAEHGDFILQAEEHLAIEADKHESPLHFASTDNAFLVDAWVPTADVERVRNELEQATSGRVHFEVQDGADHGDADDGHGASEVHGHAEAEEGEAPPTKYANPAAIQPFQFFTNLFSVPKYGEVDPTPVLAVVFPLFFGFMIGDAGYGILMMLIAYLIVSKVGHIDAAKNLSYGLFFAGLVALFVGAVVFVEAFGIPFGANHHMLEELEHEHVAVTCANIAHHLSETTWSCLLGQGVVLAEPVLGKLTDVTDLLVLSVVAAIVHLGLGFLFGIKNEWPHSKRHATAKAAWLVMAVGLFYHMMYMAQGTAIGGPIFRFLGAYQGTVLGDVVAGGVSQVAIFLGVPAFIALVATEGAMGALEVPTLVSHMVSYTRLAGVAVAKGAMAFAFNSLFLVGMVLEGDGSILIIIVGFVLLLLTQTMVFVLGMISSGIQAIRLHYVEFFLKFYKGGGHPFSPFGRIRKHTELT